MKLQSSVFVLISNLRLQKETILKSAVGHSGGESEQIVAATNQYVKCVIFYFFLSKYLPGIIPESTHTAVFICFLIRTLLGSAFD